MKRGIKQIRSREEYGGNNRWLLEDAAGKYFTERKYVGFARIAP